MRIILSILLVSLFPAAVASQQALGSLEETQGRCAGGEGRACLDLVSYSVPIRAPVFLRDGETLYTERAALWPLFDEAQAALYLDRACALQANLCADAGQFWLRSAALPRNYHRAREFFDRGCLNGSGHSCFVAANSYYSPLTVPERELDLAVAVDYLQRGCDLSSARSCARLAYQFEVGEGVELGRERSEILSTQACLLAGSPECESLLQEVQPHSLHLLDDPVFRESLENERRNGRGLSGQH